MLEFSIVSAKPESADKSQEVMPPPPPPEAEKSIVSAVLQSIVTVASKEVNWTVSVSATEKEFTPSEKSKVMPPPPLAQLITALPLVFRN